MQAAQNIGSVAHDAPVAQTCDEELDSCVEELPVVEPVAVELPVVEPVAVELSIVELVAVELSPVELFPVEELRVLLLLDDAEEVEAVDRCELEWLESLFVAPVEADEEDEADVAVGLLLDAEPPVELPRDVVVA